jgi:hypothetical protein
MKLNSYNYCSNNGKRCKDCAYTPKSVECVNSMREFGHQCGIRKDYGRTD